MALLTCLFCSRLAARTFARGANLISCRATYLEQEKKCTLQFSEHLIKRNLQGHAFVHGVWQMKPHEKKAHLLSKINSLPNHLVAGYGEPARLSVVQVFQSHLQLVPVVLALARPLNKRRKNTTNNTKSEQGIPKRKGQDRQHTRKKRRQWTTTGGANEHLQPGQPQLFLEHPCGRFF